MVSNIQKEFLIRKFEASSFSVTSTQQQTIDCSYSGYTPIGLLAFDASDDGQYQNNINIYSWEFDGDNLIMGYRVLTNVTAVVKPKVTILYVKS